MMNKLFAISKTVADPFPAIMLQVVELVPLEILLDDRLHNARRRSFMLCISYDSGTQKWVAVIDTSECFAQAIERIRCGFLDAEHQVVVHDAGSLCRTLEYAGLEVRAGVGVFDLIRCDFALTGDLVHDLARSCCGGRRRDCHGWYCKNHR